MELLISSSALTNFLHFIYEGMLLLQKSLLQRSNKYCIAFVISKIVKIIFRKFVAPVEFSASKEQTSWLRRREALVSIFLCLYHCLILSICKYLVWLETVSAWNSEYLASSKALWTKRFFPTIFQRLKSKTFFTDSKLSQIITRHDKFKNYLCEFMLTDSDKMLKLRIMFCYIVNYFRVNEINLEKSWNGYLFLGSLLCFRQPILLRILLILKIVFTV